MMVQEEKPDGKQDQGVAHGSDGVRGTKRKTEDGGHEEGKRQDSMIVSCLREEELMKREIHGTVMTRDRYYLGSVEDNENKNANMAMAVPQKPLIKVKWVDRNKGDRHNT